MVINHLLTGMILQAVGQVGRSLSRIFLGGSLVLAHLIDVWSPYNIPEQPNLTH